MKNKLTINGYPDNRGEIEHGTPGRLPLVHMIGHTGGATHQSISFNAHMADQVIDMIKDAAAFARVKEKGTYSLTLTWDAPNPDIYVGPCQGGWSVETPSGYYGPFETEAEARGTAEALDEDYDNITPDRV